MVKEPNTNIPRPLNHWELLTAVLVPKDADAGVLRVHRDLPDSTVLPTTLTEQMGQGAGPKNSKKDG